MGHGRCLRSAFTNAEHSLNIIVSLSLWDACKKHEAADDGVGATRQPCRRPCASTLAVHCALEASLLHCDYFHA